eukprot:15307604-Alexandrium_andersonii.AAC.1
MGRIRTRTRFRTRMLGPRAAWGPPPRPARRPAAAGCADGSPNGCPRDKKGCGAHACPDAVASPCAR